jgi:putative NADH-flavin reductase
MSESRFTVLAVGASGSIGRYVVASALNRGYAVRALVTVLERMPPRYVRAHHRLEHPPVGRQP